MFKVYNIGSVMSMCLFWGQVVAAEQKVESCSIQDVELHATKVFVVSGSLPRLPLQVELCLH